MVTVFHICIYDFDDINREPDMSVYFVFKTSEDNMIYKHTSTAFE